MFDPPADPLGIYYHCRICDTPMVRDDWTKEWYCPKADEHPRKDRKMDDTVSTLRAEWLEAEKDKIEVEISRMMDLRQYYQNMAELSPDNYATEKWIRLANLVDRQIDELKVKKDNLSLSVPAAWMEEGTHPSPIISGGEVLDTNESKGGDDIPF